mgnify:CR=1 FL=1
MIGKPGGPVLVTLAERRTRYSAIAKAPDKSAQAVTDALLTALQPHADLVHTLTYDNGKEFAYHQTVAEGIRRPRLLRPPLPFHCLFFLGRATAPDTPMVELVLLCA